MHMTFKSIRCLLSILVREHRVLSLHRFSITWGTGAIQFLIQQVLVGEPRNLHSQKFPVDAMLVQDHFEKLALPTSGH